jgi:hypothetical protein
MKILTILVLAAGAFGQTSPSSNGGFSGFPSKPAYWDGISGNPTLPPYEAPQATSGTGTSSAPCGVPYAYFAGSGITYDYFANLPATNVDFGVRTASCSNLFLVTDISTGIGSNSQTNGYANLSEYVEYHLAHSGNWEFLGLGAFGVTSTTSTTGTAYVGTFAGGIGVQYDIGYALSKKAFHLPILFTYRINAVNATQVKPVYGFEVRKTFGN